MKNLIKTAIFAFTLLTAFNYNASAEDKMKTTAIETVLPASVPLVDSPAPENKINDNTNSVRYTAEQKAALVELELSITAKAK